MGRLGRSVRYYLQNTNYTGLERIIKNNDFGQVMCGTDHCWTTRKKQSGNTVFVEITAVWNERFLSTSLGSLSATTYHSWVPLLSLLHYAVKIYNAHRDVNIGLQT